MARQNSYANIRTVCPTGLKTRAELEETKSVGKVAKAMKRQQERQHYLNHAEPHIVTTPSSDVPATRLAPSSFSSGSVTPLDIRAADAKWDVLPGDAADTAKQTVPSTTPTIETQSASQVKHPDRARCKNEFLLTDVECGQESIVQQVRDDLKSRADDPGTFHADSAAGHRPPSEGFPVDVK